MWTSSILYRKAIVTPHAQRVCVGGGGGGGKVISVGVRISESAVALSM